MNTYVQFYTVNEQTGYAEFYMPKVDAVASTWGGIAFTPAFPRTCKRSPPFGRTAASRNLTA